MKLTDINNEFVELNTEDLEVLVGGARPVTPPGNGANVAQFGVDAQGNRTITTKNKTITPGLGN